jgi:hypothetical protein
MVTRKPVGGHKAGPATSTSPPAVPSTPTVTAPTPTSPTAAPLIPSNAAPSHSPPPPPPPPLDKDAPAAAKKHETQSDSDSEDEDEDEWDKSDTSEDEWEMTENDDPKLTPPTDIPASLRISRPPSQELDKGKEKELPSVLKVGPPGDITQVSNESLTSMENNNPWRPASQSPPKDGSYNPFLRPQNTGEALFGSQNSSAVWSGASSPQPAGVVAELSATMSPTDEFRNLEISELPSVSSPVGTQAPPLPIQPRTEQEKSQYAAMSLADPFEPMPAEGLITTQQAWQDESSRQQGKQKEKAVVTPQSQPTAIASLLDVDDEPVPSLPPRTSDDDQAPPKPPRPEVDTGRAVPASAESPNTVMKKQRNQTYQIKKIRWFDNRVRSIRVSPILVQNANGPCPLLALVNALTLSTPRDLDTGLVETLRLREQVSLGLLLDAVFEELMSGRRGDGAQELPDVGELYSFLIALHTGMNVNPQYTRQTDNPLRRQPGSFEQTKEMTLYSTFSIPLIHGWIPEPDSEAYAAFDRSAKTYEDAQNIQFYEEELEAKLSSSGLNTEEQHMFEDLVSIKHFQTTWPTQLTEHGLNVIREHLRPGQFAILFRNDHFSTVYKEPRSNALLTVVTDAGYASHDEIVWESLVDINGMRTEHFSGDFRPVSHNAPIEGSKSGPSVGPRNSSLGGQIVQSMLDVDQGWTQVAGKKGKQSGNNISASSSSQQTGVIGSSSIVARQEVQSSDTDRSKVEQEDADLALALQLQEEEEDRQRRQENEHRNRQLSSQVLDQNTPPTPINRPLVPPRRQAPQFTTNRPTSTSDEAPPPSYEDASKDRRFNPPPDHPASPHAPISPTGAGSSHNRQHSAYATMAGNTSGLRAAMSSTDLHTTGVRRPSRPLQGGPSAGFGRPSLIDRIPDQGIHRRRSSGPVGGLTGPGGREEKCVVM